MFLCLTKELFVYKLWLSQMFLVMLNLYSYIYQKSSHTCKGTAHKEMALMNMMYICNHYQYRTFPWILTCATGKPTAYYFMGHATNFTYKVYSTLTPQLYNVFCDPESKLECVKLSHKRGLKLLYLLQWLWPFYCLSAFSNNSWLLEYPFM